MGKGESVAGISHARYVRAEHAAFAVGVAVVAAIAPLSLLSGEAHAEGAAVSQPQSPWPPRRAKQHPRLRRPRRLRKRRPVATPPQSPSLHARLQR